MKKARFKKAILSVSVCGVMALTCQGAFAYEKGDIIVRGGAALVDPNESSSVIRIDQPGLGDAGNARVGVNSNTQAGLTLSYMTHNNMGLELLAATPFSHDISGAGALAGAGKLAETKHLPPTLTFNYYPNSPSDKFQPYIGLGLNYTIFFDESVTSTLNNAGTIDTLAGLAGAGPGAITAIGDMDIELSDSWGLAFHAGFDYQLTDNIGINAAYWKIDIETQAEITTTSTAGGYTGPVTAAVDVDIDPSVYMLGVSYKF